MRDRCVLLCLLLVLAYSVAWLPTAIAQTKELPVYNEWQGRDCRFTSDRPFFLIRDIHDLSRFWAESGSDEPAPGIDFAKYMLLVWCPGASLFDFVPVSVERFVYREGNYFVLMSFERKDTGGFWRRPFMATMLPLVESGDIFVMRKVPRGANATDWQPVYSIWDMSGDRKRPLEVAQLETMPLADPGFVTAGSAGQNTEPAVAVAAGNDQPGSIQGQQVAATPAQEPATAVSAPTSTSGGMAQTETAPAAESPVAGTGGTSQTGSQFPATPSEPVKNSTLPAATTPAIDEDPLFGSEFDITF